MKIYVLKLIFFLFCLKDNWKKKLIILEMFFYILYKKKGIRNEVDVESYDLECFFFNVIYISEKNIGVILN